MCRPVFEIQNKFPLGNDPERQLGRGYKRTQISRVIWFLCCYTFFLNTQTEMESESLKMEKAGGVVAAAPTNTVVSAMDAFEKLEKVGEGTYGKVYRARERATGKIVALKKTRLHEDDEGVPTTTLREVSILRMLSRDPHVVRYSLSAFLRSTSSLGFHLCLLTIYVAWVCRVF